MFIAHFTEEPWQNPRVDPTKLSSADGGDPQRISVSNKWYEADIGAQLYNRYLDEKLYAEEVGFDGLMLNEHHSMPGCMQGVTNVQAAILARQTKRVKLAILGNLVPLWDDPLWIAEQVAMIDMISGGRIVSGWVRGGGRESITHNANPTYNWERFQEAHDFIVKCWTVPGPWRWEGKHYSYRYVNPWAMPLQKPHPPIWVPGTGSRETVIWAAERAIPYMSFATQLDLTKDLFSLYHQTASESSFKSGSQNVGYNWKVHVDETEDLAYEVGKKFLAGVSNPFIAGTQGAVLNPAVATLPGLSPSSGRPRGAPRQQRPAGFAVTRAPYDEQLKNYTIVAGTPSTVIPKVRHVLEYLRIGTVFFWDGDGSMTHEDQMRSLRLMGQEVIPAVREISKELGLPGPFEVSTATGQPISTPSA